MSLLGNNYSEVVSESAKSKLSADLRIYISVAGIRLFIAWKTLTFLLGFQ